MAFEFVSFTKRNPSYSLHNWRSLAHVRRAMAAFRRDNPVCAWCGRGRKVDVHHNIPVSVAPELAGDTNNMITLCRKPQCHMIVGHNGHYGGRYTVNIKEVCANNQVTKILKNV